MSGTDFFHDALNLVRIVGINLSCFVDTLCNLIDIGKAKESTAICDAFINSIQKQMRE